MQTAVQSLAIILAGLTLALAGMALVRRSTHLSFLEAHREIAGFVYAVVGVIYAVLLAFVCIVAWERFDQADSAVQRESSTITSLAEIAQTFGEPASSQVQTALLAYTREVTSTEWELMGSGRESPRAAQLLADVWQDYSQLPAAVRAEAAYGESLRLLAELQNERGERLNYAEDVVPRVVWVFLIAGAALTIAFTYLFGVRSLLAQSLITGAITLMVVGVLVLTYVLDDPFRGDVRVSAERLRMSQDFVAAQLAQPPPEGSLAPTLTNLH